MKDRIQARYSLIEICALTRQEEREIREILRREWIRPASSIAREAINDPRFEPEFDEEDLARCRLISELRATFEVNDEAIPIILGLVDQLHALRVELARRARDARAA